MLNSLHKAASIRIELHIEKSIRNLIESTRNHIVFTIFRFIFNQSERERMGGEGKGGRGRNWTIIQLYNIKAIEYSIYDKNNYLQSFY